MGKKMRRTMARPSNWMDSHTATSGLTPTERGAKASTAEVDKAASKTTRFIIIFSLSKGYYCGRWWYLVRTNAACGCEQENTLPSKMWPDTTHAFALISISNIAS